MSRPSRMRFSTHRPSYPPPGMPDTERPATGSQTARLQAKKQSGEHLNERTGFEIPGYQGHMHGYHQTFGGSRARVVTDAETGRLPILKAPMPIPSRSYYEMSPERSKDYKGPRPQGLVRNKSCVYIGDERQSHFQTSLSEDFKDWTSDDTSVNPLPTRKEIERVYHDATKRVPQWRVDEIENAMRAKIEQKTRGGAFVFRRAFKYFDRDGSGGVDLKELRDGLDIFGLQFDEYECAALMARYDSSMCGEIDYCEFVSNLMENDWFEKKADKIKTAVSNTLKNALGDSEDTAYLIAALASKSVLSPADVDRMFGELDVDQNGNMDKAELLGFIYLLGVDNVAPEKVYREFNRMDKDKNGKVDKHEFTDWLKSLALVNWRE